MRNPQELLADARLYVNAFYKATSSEDLEVWRQAQQKLISAAGAVAVAEAQVENRELHVEVNGLKLRGFVNAELLSNNTALRMSLSWALGHIKVPATSDEAPWVWAERDKAYAALSVPSPNVTAEEK